MGRKRLPSCKHCGRKFSPDARNRDRQQVCGRVECVAAADRARKRKYYRKRIENEEGFQESERRRCRKAMRRCRARTKNGGTGQSAPDLPLLLSGHLFAGLVSQFVDSTDPHVVARVMDSYADRGRRLAVGRSIRGSP